MMIKAVIFDFGGTVLDTETPRYQSFLEAYRQQGAELDWSLYAQCIGTGFQDFNPYEDLLGRMKLPVQLNAFRDAIRSRCAELTEQEQLRPGVMDALVRAKAMGLKIGLVSSLPRREIDPYLQKWGIAPYFDCIRTADDATRLAPDPELYQQAVRMLGVNPRQAAAIEDSPAGAEAAMLAGMYTVVVPNATTAGMKFGHCHARLDSLDQLELPELLDRVQGAKAMVYEPAVFWNRVLPIEHEAEVG
ncbi:HAD family phosphatase [Paenibacillus sp. YN15]|uniref:HAD family hydrolase n=1 Tax=Paenibacillus sp. YN15 TaxID=1742774 RepID=UPI0015EB95E5|nr:HAD family phosphatase [Paenibacillus sp. YN15]